jgi:hypothetical protein
MIRRVTSRTSRYIAAAIFVAGMTLLCLSAAAAAAPETPPSDVSTFPPPLESYDDAHLPHLWDVLQNRVRKAPFNLVATMIFLGAVIHTFLTHKFIRLAHVLEEKQKGVLAWQGLEPGSGAAGSASVYSIGSRVLHFLGEVEAVFGIWVLPLVGLMIAQLGWTQTLEYLNYRVGYAEPLFVVVIMVISSTKPIIGLAEACLRFFARIGGGGTAAWWLAILTVGPLLGSIITEPAAMTISALLLGRQFYRLGPPPALAYATLGLLFVNVSVGGVLTHFAAPPVLMVAAPWGWNTAFMFRHFGWIAVVGILVSNLGYYLVFRRRIGELGATPAGVAPVEAPPGASEAVPAWVTIGHLAFMAWTVFNAHYPVLVVGGFLFFIAFFEVTADYQTELQMRSPILVGFFLAGLVIHGGLQQWWIAPLMRRLSEVPLMLGAIGLTSFNDNAAVTYLSTLVPNLSEGMRYAVVAGAVTGGGLTVIANAPNPAGQSILSRYFPDGISPLGLLLGALPATIVFAAAFLLLG